MVPPRRSATDEPTAADPQTATQRSRKVLLFPWVRGTAELAIAGTTLLSARKVLPAEHLPVLGVFKDTRGTAIPDCFAAPLAEGQDEDSIAGLSAAFQFVALYDPELYADILTPYVLTLPDVPSSSAVLDTAIGRIGGNVSNLEVRCPWPLRPATVNTGGYEAGIARVIADWWTSASPEYRRLFRAAQLYIRSRQLGVTWEERLLLNAAAAEALLNLPDEHIHDAFTRGFCALFAGHPSVADWADNAYTVRSSIAHGAPDVVNLRSYRPTSPVVSGSSRLPAEAVGWHDVIADAAVRNGILLKIHGLLSDAGDRATVNVILVTSLISKLYHPRVLIHWLCTQGVDRIAQHGAAFAEFMSVSSLLPEIPGVTLAESDIATWKALITERLAHVDKRDGGNRHPFTQNIRHVLRDVHERVCLWEQLAPLSGGQ